MTARTLILGGVRSGKSRLAVTYIATARARDAEMPAHTDEKHTGVQERIGVLISMNASAREQWK